MAGLPIEDRKGILDLLSQIRQRMLTPERLRQYDKDEVFPEDVIRELLGPKIGLQLLFIPEEYGGMGGGARDIAAVSEEMAKICLGVATAFLAIHLGTDPILVGATEAQKEKWLTKLAEGDAIVAYAVTEPEAGSNLSNLKTTASPVLDDQGEVTGYRINGTKQFISNGGYADFLTVLAQTAEGPSFFIVEKSMEGFHPGKPEEKHGIRSSNTAALAFDNVFVPVENLVGGVPGQGLAQANEVFGYTRLMVAAFGLGAGVAALDKVIPFAKERVQFGSPLIEKQGYTHKLILPFVAKLEAARAYIDEVAARIDSGETDLQLEGSLAKLFATEVGNACADAAIQALGGYGYIREYDVEKIKRDVKITTIYEGTSEIQQLIISTFRWREEVKSKGGFYESLAQHMDAVHESHPDVKADTLAGIIRLLSRLFEEAHQAKATRQQHVMFQLATLASVVETGAALLNKMARGDDADPTRAEHLRLCARINTAFCAQTACSIASEILYGSGQWSSAEAKAILETVQFDYGPSQAGLIPDMDQLRTML
ncbi:MAG: acyl-CoA dehydrogenase [Actinobacteria bacterium RBG_16_64_13]|nr:MAG: acyl-CoA dehydrogenase [Actinobacteria bacterium RBG_16_64_13]